MVKKSLKEVLKNCRATQKSLIAFNVQNLYQLSAAKSITEKQKAPVIIQFSERFLRFLDKNYTIEFILNKYSNQFIYFHLDHCIDLNFIKYCIEKGFDSVMYDGSAFVLEKNIEQTNEIKAFAKGFQCLVEGELGKVSGVEDGFGEEGSSYAEIREIETYVRKTNIDLMALGIGNAHGFYENLDGIDLSILKEASEKLDQTQFFVLHGGTGLPKEIIVEAISFGVVKINVSTHLKKKTMEILKSYASSNSLYNEIEYHNTMVEGISTFFEDYLITYTL